MRILFVCLGNICRSPLAEGIARDLIEKEKLDIEVDSAGTGSWHIGEVPCENSIKVAKMNSVDISSLRARQVQKSDFSEFDLLVAMDSQNYRDLKAMGAENLKLLGEFGASSRDVPDPYFFDGFSGFDLVFEMIEMCVKNLLKEHK